MDQFLAEAYAEIDEMGLDGPLPVPKVDTPAHWPALVICRACHRSADRWNYYLGCETLQYQLRVWCHGAVETSVIDSLWVQMNLDKPWFAFEKKSGGAA